MMMKWHIFATIILIQLKTFYCNTIEISSYSKVAKNGHANEEPTKNTNQPPQIHRAREGVINSDLWFPKTFNETETNANLSKATGRAIDNGRPFPFPLKNVIYSSYDKPSNHRSNHEPRIIYASSPSIQQIAQDRFVPHESTDHFIEKNNRNRVKSQAIYKESDRESDNSPPQVDAPPSDARPPTIDYQPPKNLYSFPPNSDSLYSAPGDTRKPISVSSYLPPPSGISNYPIYPGPIMPKPVSSLNTQADNSDLTNSDMGADDSGSSNMDGDTNMGSANPDGPSDDMKLIDRPPPNFMPSKKPEFPALAFLNQGPPDHDHSHDHDHEHDHLHEHDDHFHDHGSFSPYDDSLKHLHGFDAFPEVIVDDSHHDYFDHHHHFDHPPPPPPPPTTPPPPPPLPPPEPEEPEEQPRVKKYSYFYLSRSLWYIPLYFTVWFTFYVTYLILLSIGRHKVDLPNHITNRRSIRDLTHSETVDKVNTLTNFVMSQIEDFEKKYF